MIQIVVSGTNFLRKMRREVLIRHFSRRMSQTMLGFGTYAKSKIRRELLGNQLGLADLNLVTIINKGSTIPLVHTGDLANSSAFEMIRDLRVGIIGVKVRGKKDVHGPSGLSYKRIWQIMHEGASYTPTPSQRRYMAMLLERLGIKLTGRRKAIWNIPARPFAENALMNIDVEVRFYQAVDLALKRALDDWMK